MESRKTSTDIACQEFKHAVILREVTTGGIGLYYQNLYQQTYNRTNIKFSDE